MKNRKMNVLWGLLVGGALALSMTQTVRAAEMGWDHYPYNYCMTCFHPLWFYR
ncbi:hypothetical protein [Yersinia massiliensis]|uniref:hypothetical protein n=1 Tax=Yersinia massiliensis TaxID=419257 RepID=UPI0002DC3496|nr:hypothetical protein [Yersinia massiliensis]